MTRLTDARWMPNNGTLHAIAARIGAYESGAWAMRARCGAIISRRRPVDPDRSPARLCPYCLAALGIDVVDPVRRVS